MRALSRSGARAALTAAAVAVVFGLGSLTAAEAAPVGASAGTHVADVAKSNPGVEKVHRRWHHRHWRPYYGYGYGYRYRPYYYTYPYRRHYGYYGGYPYYGGYGWRRPGVYLRFGF